MKIVYSRITAIFIIVKVFSCTVNSLMAPNFAKRDYERDFIIDCIRLYRDLPSLWNVKSKQYHDRKKKNKAYDLLLAKYKEMFPEATKEDLKKKLNTLRTNYRKELKKQMSSIQSGDSPYQPSLWYFNEMNFLHDDDFLAESNSSLLNISQNSTVYPESEQRSDSPYSISDEDEIEEVSETPRKKSRKDNQLINLAYECLTDKNDEFYHWAMASASDLRKMESTQQVYAKKAISDIIMEGQLGLLHRNSVKINEGNSKHTLM